VQIQATHVHDYDAARRLWATLAQRMLQFYWLTCIFIVGLGLNQLHPEVGAKIAYAFRDPALDLAKPFPNCPAAHYAGYFNIPRASAAYVPLQDGDSDGVACEPYRGYPPGPFVRLNTIQQRLLGPRP
jgi:hypothetical protein